MVQWKENEVDRGWKVVFQRVDRAGLCLYKKSSWKDHMKRSCFTVIYGSALTLQSYGIDYCRLDLWYAMRNIMRQKMYVEVGEKIYIHGFKYQVAFGCQFDCKVWYVSKFIYQVAFWCQFHCRVWYVSKIFFLKMWASLAIITLIISEHFRGKLMLITFYFPEFNWSVNTINNWNVLLYNAVNFTITY